MSGDRVLTQAEIDALVAQAPQKATATPVNDIAKPQVEPEYDPLPAKLTRLEANYETVKSDIQAILLDLREMYLEGENPFNSLAAASPRTINTHRKKAQDK